MLLYISIKTATWFGILIKSNLRLLIWIWFNSMSKLMLILYPYRNTSICKEMIEINGDVTYRGRLLTNNNYIIISWPAPIKVALQLISEENIPAIKLQLKLIYLLAQLREVWKHMENIETPGNSAIPNTWIRTKIKR